MKKGKLLSLAVIATGVLAVSTQAFAQSYTAADVALHGTEQDCWMIISGKVYDVSAFISSHPGGRSSMIPYCGKDATVAFDTKGGRGSHSSFASSLLPNYFQEDLVSASGSSPVSPVVTTPATQTPPLRPNATVIHEQRIPEQQSFLGDDDDDRFDEDESSVHDEMHFEHGEHERSHNEDDGQEEGDDD